MHQWDRRSLWSAAACRSFSIALVAGYVVQQKTGKAAPGRRTP